MRNAAGIHWLKENFGWSECTAQKYMRIGTVFGKNRPGRHLEDISIDAKALYLLSAPATRNLSGRGVHRQPGQLVAEQHDCLDRVPVTPNLQLKRLDSLFLLPRR